MTIDLPTHDVLTVEATFTSGGREALLNVALTAQTLAAGEAHGPRASLDDGTWIFSDDEGGVFGAGDTVAEALADFSQAVIEHIEVLESAEQLAPTLARQLKYLRARYAR